MGIQIEQSVSKMATALHASPEPNYYHILGVSAEVDPHSLKKAFHHLTKLYHPDKNPTHTEKFKEISRAYRILSDPSKRREYDLKLHHQSVFSQRRQQAHAQHHHHQSMAAAAAAAAQAAAQAFSTIGRHQSPQGAVPQPPQQADYQGHHRAHFNQHCVGGDHRTQHYNLHAAPHQHPHPQAGAPHSHYRYQQQPTPQQTYQHQYQQHPPSWDTSRVQIVRCAHCHGTGTSLRYERLGRGLMRETRVLCLGCSGRGTWCKLYSLQA